LSVEKHVTTGLDALALLLAAAGVLGGLWPVIAGWSIACGGVVVFLGVRFIDGDVQALLRAVRGRRGKKSREGQT
jgi:hypothetical protein